MATDLMPAVRRWLVVAAILLASGGIAFLAYDRYRERYAVTTPAEGGAPITALISARLSGANTLKVAVLSGTVQSTASDIRGFGWLRSDQVVKMPFTVDYFVDVSRIGARDIEWSDRTGTLIVKAPDITVARANVDEARRSLVRTTGIFVTRKAAEELALRTSIHATDKADAEAASPARIAQARELARAALVKLYAAPLRALGHANARVIVTFPPERRRINGEQWDVSRSVDDVLNNRS